VCGRQHYRTAERIRKCSQYQFADPEGMTGLVGQPGEQLDGRPSSENEAGGRPGYLGF